MLRSVCSHQAKHFMCHLADLGKVVFGVTAEHSEFPNFEFELATINNEVLLEDIEKRLSWHDPPLRLKTVNNVPASARPGNKALVANFKDGDRLELVADIAPGDATWEHWFPFMTAMHRLLHCFEYVMLLACRTCSF